MSDHVEKLEHLQSLKDKGTLTEEEFQVEKAKILADEPTTEKAATPPHPQSPPKKSGSGSGCGTIFAYIVGGLLVLFILAQIFGGGSSSSDWAFDVKYEAVEIVKAHLKAPSTAKFPSYSDIKLTTIDDSQLYTIIEYDAQNSFGAYLRGYAKVYFKKSGGKWYYDHMDSE